MKSRLVSLFPQQDWSQINCKLYRRHQKAQKSIDDQIQESKPIFHSSQLGLGLPQSKNDGEGAGSYNLRGRLLSILQPTMEVEPPGEGERRGLSLGQRERQALKTHSSLQLPSQFGKFSLLGLTLSLSTTCFSFLVFLCSASVLLHTDFNLTRFPYKLDKYISRESSINKELKKGGKRRILVEVRKEQLKYLKRLQILYKFMNV